MQGVKKQKEKKLSKNKIKNDNKEMPYLLDAELLPFIEKAKKGCIMSQAELANAFSEGKGASMNIELAKKYHEMLFNSTNDEIIELVSIWNIAISENRLGNYENMKDILHFAIDFMQEHIPMEEWDFSLFQIMKELTQDREN